jgi:hypothetical protein
LQNSPIPVIVVRPNAQRARSLHKRRADRNRQQYRDILDVSGGDDLQSMSQEQLEFMEDEAAAVAAAIGIQQQKEGEKEGPPTPGTQARQSPLVQVQLVDEAALPGIGEKLKEAESLGAVPKQEPEAEKGGKENV